MHCKEEELYARLVATIVKGNLSLGNDATVTHSLDYVTFTRPYDTVYFLSKFDH